METSKDQIKAILLILKGSSVKQCQDILFEALRRVKKEAKV